jgi:hypothetical protein
VEVSPLRVELKSAAGGTTTQAITVSNTGKDPVRVRAMISDWYLSRDGSPQFAESPDARYSASSWIRIAPPEQVVDPGRDATVRFTLTIPADAPPAGYRTSILFSRGQESVSAKDRWTGACGKRLAGASEGRADADPTRTCCGAAD